MSTNLAITSQSSPRSNDNSTFPAIFRKSNPNEKIQSQALETIRNNMPVRTLFTPKLKIDVKLFVEGQMLFLKIAKFIALIDGADAVTSGSIEKHFEKNSSLLTEIKVLFKDPVPYLRYLYDACCDVLNNKAVTDNLTSAIEKRIFTLKNALIAQHTPKAFSKNQTQKPIEDLANIQKEAACFIRFCLSLHLQAHKSTKKSYYQQQLNAIASFQKQLTTVAEQLIPFTQEVTEQYLKEYEIHWTYPPTYESLTTHNYHGIVAATVMEVSLKVLGYRTQILTRSDLEPSITLVTVHRVIEVKGPANSRYMVDPSYIQFHMDSCSDVKLLPKASVLVLQETEVDRYIENTIIANLKSRFQLASDNKEAPDLFKSFKRVWDLSTSYTPIRLDMVCQEIFFGMRPEKQKTYQYIESMNLHQLLLDRYSIIETDEILKQNFYPVKQKNTEEALSLIAQLPLEWRLSHKDLLDLDPRIAQVNTIVNAYFCSLRKVVNPEGKDLSVIYGCSGADCMSVLLATDAHDLCLVDLTEVSLSDFQQALTLVQNQSIYLKNRLDANDHYVSVRAHYMASISIWDIENDKHTMPNLALKLLLDLYDMGIDLHKVHLKAVDGGVCMEFPWQYCHASVLRNRTVTFAYADITKPDQYPAPLKKRMKEGFDIFYMKAAYFVPLSYSQFLPVLLKPMRKDGWLMTTDEAYTLEKVNPEPLLEQNGLAFVQKKNEETDRLAKYLATPSGIAKPPTIQVQQPRENLRPTQGLSYWTILNLRQKVR